MTTKELIKRLEHLSIEIGNIGCLVCGYEDNCETHGCTILRNAAAMLKYYEESPLRPVVTCGRCRFWTKQKDSAQGRCELSGIYPTGGFFCANGREKEGGK